MGAIDPQQLQDELQKKSQSVGGLDGFIPNDLSMSSILATTKLAKLLDLIELGSPWPDDLTHGKGAFLAKDPDELEDPLGYRPLLVMSNLYRAWASFRHMNMKPTII